MSLVYDSYIGTRVQAHCIHFH